MYVFAVVFGIGLGGDYMIIPLMTAEIFGVKILGRLMGVLLTAGGIQEAPRPGSLASCGTQPAAIRRAASCWLGLHCWAPWP